MAEAGGSTKSGVPPVLTEDSVLRALVLEGVEWNIDLCQWGFRIPYYEIARIEKLEHKMRASVAYWLQHNPTPSWRGLIRVLEHEYVGQYKAAEKIYSYAEPLTDPTLTMETILSATESIGYYDWMGKLLGVPKTKRSNPTTIISHWLSVGERPFWNTLACKLFFMKEKRSLQRVKKYLPSPPTDPTLTTHNLISVLEEVEDWDSVTYGMGILRSKQNAIKKQYPNNPTLYKYAICDYFVTSHPCPSWALVSHTLYRRWEHKVLKEVQEKYPTAIAPWKRLNACRKAIQEKGSMDKIVMQAVFWGFPRSGKTSLKCRLVGIKNPVTTSTGVAEKVIQVQISKSVIQVSGTTWQEISDLDDKTFVIVNDIFVSVSSQQSAEPGEETLSSTESDSSASAKVSGSLSSFIQALKSLFKKKESHAGPATPLNPSSKTKLQSTETGSVSSSPSSVDPLQVISSSITRSSAPSRLQLYLEEPWILYMTDAGGQPEFQELLPVLVSGPTLFFLVFRLDKDLNAKCLIEYLHPNGTSIVPFEASFSMMDALLQSLASIISTGGFINVLTGERVMPKVLFIGTHKDQVTSEEKLKEIDRQLQDTVRKTDAFQEGLIEFASSSTMMLTVNNLSESEEDVEKVRAVVHRIGTQSTNYRVCTPYPWMIFGITLNHIEDKVLSYNSCLQIAEKCGIENCEELNSVLWFFHNHVGIIRYFQDIPELRDIVIKDPQYIFDKVTELVVNTFTFERTGIHTHEEFLKRGIFPHDMFLKLSTEFSVLTPEKFIKLLEHLRIIAPLVEADKEVKYFVPCALTHADLPPPQSANSTVPELYIAFQSGYCPKGLFGSLVVRLITKKDWTLEEDMIYRDQLCLSVGPYDSFRLTLNPKYIRIDLVSSLQGHRKIPIGKVCSDVRQCIEHNIEEVISVLNYTKKASHTVAFVCPETEDGESVHPATVNMYDGEPCSMTCSKTGKRFDLPTGHEFWYNEEVDYDLNYANGNNEEISANTKYENLSAKSLTLIKWKDSQGQLQTLRIIDSACNCWHVMGKLCDIPPAELNAVATKHRDDPITCCDAVLTRWLQNCSREYPATWYGLVKLLDDTQLTQVASTLKIALGL